MSPNHVLTSESVSEGHPDKIADIISDTILDLFLARDPYAKVACETFVTARAIIIAGEFRTEPASLLADIERQIPDVVRHLLKEIGYSADFPGIDPDACEITLLLNAQSDDIYRGVSLDDGGTGAGDQGLMFGYACDETPELMPLPISLAHQLVRRQASVRKEGVLPWLRPDAKSQVSVRYEDTEPVYVEAVVLSTQHDAAVTSDEVREGVIEHIINTVVPAELRGPSIRYIVNPTGQFIIGGPQGDTGLTGRKIIVDSYGGACPHGGGAFSGKDPTKVDRSAAYMARYIAKNIVAAKLARRWTVHLGYSIGMEQPVSLYLDLHDTGVVDEEELASYIPNVFDVTPKGIIETLKLRRPIYRSTACYGHFGRSGPDYTWEHLDYRSQLRAYFGLEVEASVRNQKDVQNLGRYLKEVESGKVSEQMKKWWLNRY